MIPWDALASVYAKRSSTTYGRESIDVRMVIRALIVKHKLKLDDRSTVLMIGENIYLQYFCGLRSFQKEKPCHTKVFLDIRKRMGAVQFDLWNALIIEKADRLKPKRKQTIDKDENKKDKVAPNPNKGSLKIDATVANQKIVFPTDANLLNTARKKVNVLLICFTNRQV
ncbi:MAG: transposase [Flavobacteriaceae bacterium]|nr:transposase [Flavobacteriaceae bacterium]